MHTARDVAYYFLTLSQNDEDGELLTNLKIQKLVYFAQGFNIALNNEELFIESIEAWEHGPVVPSVYFDFCRFGRNEIRMNVPKNLSLSGFAQSLISAVYELFKQFSALGLRELTHKEGPWSEIYYNHGNRSVISGSDMFDYFSSLCNEIEQGSLPSQYSVNEMQKLIQHAHKMRVDKAYQASINQFDELYRKLATA